MLDDKEFNPSELGYYLGMVADQKYISSPDPNVFREAGDYLYRYASYIEACSKDK